MPEQGFLASLFDVEFESLITTKVIKVLLHQLSMIVIGLAAHGLRGGRVRQQRGGRADRRC